MPRRRAVKKEVSKRPAPTLPEGDEGKDMDREKRRKKVVALMHDFQAEVKSRVGNLKASINEMLNQIELAYTMEMMNIPQRIRQMPLKEYLKNGGNFEEAAASKMFGPSLNAILDENSQSGVCLGLDSICESTLAESKASHALRRRQKPAGAAANPPPTTRRGRACATPAASKISFSAATPLITPKFDPRLYQTPAVVKRDIQPGDVIMTLDGSPLVNPTEDKGKNGFPIRLKDGKVVTDENVDFNEIDFSQVNPDFMKSFVEYCNLKAMGGVLESIKDNTK